MATPREEIPVQDKTKVVLHAEIHRLIDATLDLEHVSGDYFIAWSHAAGTPSMVVSAGYWSRFDLGSDGSVRRWAVNWDLNATEVDEGMLVWFDKVADT